MSCMTATWWSSVSTIRDGSLPCSDGQDRPLVRTESARISFSSANRASVSIASAACRVRSSAVGQRWLDVLRVVVALAWPRASARSRRRRRGQ
jgi:hypothetical protein